MPRFAEGESDFSTKDLPRSEPIDLIFLLDPMTFIQMRYTAVSPNCFFNCSDRFSRSPSCESPSLVFHWPVPSFSFVTCIIPKNFTFCNRQTIQSLQEIFVYCAEIVALLQKPLYISKNL